MSVNRTTQSLLSATVHVSEKYLREETLCAVSLYTNFCRQLGVGNFDNLHLLKYHFACHFEDNCLANDTSFATLMQQDCL